MLRCIFGPNLEILSWIGGEWWHGQAQNMAIFYFEVKFDLEVQGQLTFKTIGILTKVFCSSGPNLVILAWTGDKLSRGQASDYRTQRRTHRQTQATTIPKGQNWPRVKMNLKAFNDILSLGIRIAKKTYYTNAFGKYKNDIRKTWDTLKSILYKTQVKSHFPIFSHKRQTRNKHETDSH